MMEIFRGWERLCRVQVADTFFSRLKGLMLRGHLPEGEGLLIEYSSHLPSRSIHSFLMRFPLDLIFIDEDKKVVETGSITPWRVYNPQKDCKWVLELREGTIEGQGIREGDILSFQAQ